MKKIIIALSFLISLSFYIFAFPNFVKAEQIDNFDVTITINEDASINIIERIDYDFGDLDRHGIYRDIPYKYKARGGNFKLGVSALDVSDLDGKKYNYEISNQLSYKRIKIGDADKMVSGKKSYIISYKVEKAINYFDDHDELYWNATGNEWEVPILNSSVLVVVPKGVNKKDVSYECYSGVLGSQDECLSKKLEFSNDNNVTNVLFSNNLLNARNGLTFVVGVPKGIIYEPGIFENILGILKDNFILLLPFIVFFYLFKQWQTKGKDPLGRGVIVAQFDAPNGLTPAQVGTIYDEVAHKKDVSALLISLAVKGYLKISRMEGGLIFKKTDYTFERLNILGEKDLKSFERELLKALFTEKNTEASLKTMKEALAKYDKSKNDNFVYNTLVKYTNYLYEESKRREKEKITNVVKLSSIKNTFYSSYQRIEDHIYGSLVKEGYFLKNPKKIRNTYLLIGVVVMFLSIFLGVALFGVLGVISISISGLIIIFFGFIMPVKTVKGVEAREHILGLKKYLEVAEKDRIDFHNAPEKNPKQFEKLLPYAMVLGVEKQWAKQFEGIYEKEPDWYSGAGKFNSLALVSNLSSFQTTTNNTMMSTASSGGSGFSGGSGGGGGGGGGGSW